ncbi:MAG TPA: hypothetical protein IAD49_04060 [Candidatus Fimihabitans intestinipullorum]|uniref:Uncharacterized protein n=1 Tax=Candidatus Fimihabitans intestinipullorum TaxID=2840820 RepID=A0A9D1HUC8_9BACT|nr:hypothetical protein [Candidatus Fimihabitans intestinipullorum]
MDSQRIREIVQRAVADAIEALKGYFDGQSLSQEEKAVIFDTLEAGVPYHPEELNLMTDEEKKYYDRNYMKTIHSMKSGILDHGQTVDETAEKYHNYQAIERKASRDVMSFLKENIPKSESLSSLLDTLQFDDNNENDRIYAAIFTSLLTQQLTKIMDDIATKVVEVDIQNKNTAEYDRRVQMENGDLLKIFKDQYAKVAKERAEKMAMEDAEKAAKADYEAGNEDHKEPQLLDSMSDVYRSAYVGKYSKAYKLAINKLKPHGPAADPDDELEQLRQLQEQNEKKGKKKSKPAKLKSAAHKLKVNKFGVKFLNKVGKWGQRQLNDVEDVIEEFGSVRAIHNPYRENYYSKAERERCEKILIAYERLQELLGISPARNRDGSKPYISIKDAMAVAGLTKAQKQSLQALEGKVTKAYHTLAHTAKDSTELDAIVKEADELLDQFLVREDQIMIPSIVGKVTTFLKDGEKFGYIGSLYHMPKLKEAYDILMDQKPLTRANYAKALDLTDKMEKFYELERKLAKSFMAHKLEKQETAKPAEKKPTAAPTQKPEEATAAKPTPAPTFTPVAQSSPKPSQAEPVLTQAELLRQLHEAQQETIELREKNKKLNETLKKRSKSLKSAKNDKRRLKTENTQLKQSIELLTKNVNELSRQMQQMTSDLNILRDAVAKEERQKEQYKQMVDEMRKAIKHQPSVELNSDEKEVEELASYMDRIDKKRFFENEASHDVLNDLYMLKAKGNLRPEYAEKLNKAIRQIEEGRSVAKGQPELDIPFQKHL